jgi:hypothetical protein
VGSVAAVVSKTAMRFPWMRIMLCAYLCHITSHDVVAVLCRYRRRGFSSEIFANVLAVRSPKVKVMLRSTVSLPICLGVKDPSGAQDQILLRSDSCGFVKVGRSLMEKMGLPLTIVAGPRQRILGSHSRRIDDQSPTR